jgi:sulfur dioxygenase
MIFRQLFDSTSCTYTYLLASGMGREAILIDPVKENLTQYVTLLNELELRLVVSIDTHVHADHITASGPLSKQTQCAIMMGEQTKAECVTSHFSDGQSHDFDGISLKAIYTPGHTDDSYSYLVNNRVFTGDTLFIRGTGRTDFQHGCSKAQYDSIFDNLLNLPEDTFVYPGHDYKGMTVSTIGEEKRFNPRLQVSSCDEYVKIMDNLNLPNPKLMDIAVPLNLRCGLDG